MPATFSRAASRVQAHKRKRNLFEFSGFAFEADEEVRSGSHTCTMHVSDLANNCLLILHMHDQPWVCPWGLPLQLLPFAHAVRVAARMQRCALQLCMHAYAPVHAFNGPCRTRTWRR